MKRVDYELWWKLEHLIHGDLSLSLGYEVSKDIFNASILHNKCDRLCDHLDRLFSKRTGN